MSKVSDAAAPPRPPLPNSLTPIPVDLPRSLPILYLLPVLFFSRFSILFPLCYVAVLYLFPRSVLSTCFLSVIWPFSTCSPVPFSPVLLVRSFCVISTSSASIVPFSAPFSVRSLRCLSLYIVLCYALYTAVLYSNLYFYSSLLCSLLSYPCSLPFHCFLPSYASCSLILKPSVLPFFDRLFRSLSVLGSVYPLPISPPFSSYSWPQCPLLSSL